MNKAPVGSLLVSLAIVFGLVFTSCGGGGGQPVTPPTPTANFSVSPASLSFGNVLVSPATTMTLSVTISNSGNANLVISSLPSFTGTNAGDFKLVNPPSAPITVAPNSSMTLQVSFTPAQTGTRNAGLSFTDNAAGSPHTVGLGGTGILPPAQAADASVTITSSPFGTTFPTTVTVTITGNDTTFFNGATMANFGPGATVSNGTTAGTAGQFGLVNVTSPTTATAHVTFDATAGPGPRSVIVMTAGHQSAATFVVPFHGVPVANAGMPQIVVVGKTAHLDGSASSTSNPPNPPLTYLWKMVSAPSGSTTTITDATSVRSSFVADQAGTYLVELDVTDASGNKAANWTMVSTTLTPPVANAGADQFVNPGATVQLDGSASSDFGGNSLTYAWAFAAPLPAGSAAALLNPNAVAPTFVADKAGDYPVQLTVNDGNGNTSSDTTLVSTKQTFPIANAGPNQLVNVGSQAQLNGSASQDPDGEAITCAWALLTQPAGGVSAQLSNAGPTTCSTKPTFTVGQTGMYVAQLTVADNQGNSSTANVAVVTPPDDPGPVAVAGPHQIVPKGTTVQLDGSQSNDAANNPLTYTWAMLSKPVGSTATITPATDPKPTFVADLGGDYVSQLIVSDGILFSLPSTVRVTATVPGFSASATSITFPPQHLNTTSNTMPVVITNTGNGTLHISNITKTGTNAGDFAFTSATLPIPVAPGGTTTINVTFTPTAAGARSATLNITNDATANPATITLTGTGGIPVVQFTPNPLAFSSQNVNTSAPLTLKISNTGDGSLVVTAMPVSGPNAGEFVVAPTTIPTIAPNSFTNVTVTFTPTAAGTRSATLTLTDNTSAGTDAVNFSGIGVAPGAPVFNPNPINFGNQLVGSTSATLPVLITNPGTADLIITTVAITGANAGDIALVPVPPTPITIHAGANTTLNLTFKPGAAGARTAQLSLTDNASGSPHTDLISGTGATSTISPTSVTFPGTVVGTVSAAQTVTITNPSTASGTLTLNSIGLTGTNSSEFVATLVGSPTLPLVLQPGQSQQISITFNPAAGSAAGARSATLNISDSSHATAVALSGTAQAPGISLSTTTLTFTGQTVGKPGTQPLTITNPGTANLLISALSVTGPNAGDFSVAPPAPLTVLPGGNVTLNVTFTPAVSGTRTATLNITDNATGSPQPVALIGNGVTPVIGLAPNPLAFGNQTVNIASSAKQVTISNTGNATLTISAIASSGANAADFTFTPPAPISVAAGSNTTLNVTFKPTTASAESATLTLTDNTVAGTDTISLTGTGVLPTIAFSPTGGLNFNTQLVKTASSPVALTITNNGLGTLQITSLTFTGTNAADFSFPAGFTPPTPANPITVQPSANVVLSLIFTPQNEAAETATLNIADNATGTPQSVALSGTGVAPHIALSPSPLAFGSVNQGTPSSPATITITNSGGADLSITFLSVTGANAADFALSPAPPFPITVPKNNGTATLTMVFTPATGSSETATLNFTDNAASGPNSLALTGTGLGPQMGTLSPLTFTGQSVGTTSSPQIVTVTNVGTGPMKITGLSFTGSNASDFATSTVASVGSPITVAANGATGISVTFSPSAAGTRTASLVIADNAPGNPHSVAVSGTGNPVPIFGAAPNPIVFPSTTQGVTSAPIALTISNTGQVNLVISGLTKSGANPGDYTLTIPGGGNFPQTVVPGGTLVTNVLFTPAATGASSATLLFADNTTQGSHSVSVSGTGTAPVPQCTVSPNPLTFPAQLVQSTSAPMAVTCTNNGTADLTITAAAITGTNASEFAISTGFPITVPKNGGTGNISITFTPAAGGARTATLSITDNAANSPQTVTLNGTGLVKGNFSLNSTSLGGNLETLAIGSLDVASSTALTITVTSSDPTRVLVDPNSSDPSGTAAGTGSFIATMAANQHLTPGFWIQALASSGSATVTISAPGYNPAVATVTLTPSGFQLSGPSGVGANFTATRGANPALSVNLVQLDASGNVLTPGTSEVLRGGATVSVIINSGTRATGTISGNPAVVQPGTTTSSSVTFQTIAAGTSLLTVTQPTGFITPKTGAQLTATVTAPTITLNPVSIGFNQQVLGSGRLNQAPTSTLSITITSSDSTKVLLSTNPAAAGSGSITVQVGAGGTALPAFYIQSLASSGSVTLTPSASGYTGAPAPSGSVSMTNSAFVILDPNNSGTFPGTYSTTTISPATGLTLAIYQLDSTLKPLSAGQLRPGISALSVLVNDSNPSTGTTVVTGSNPPVAANSATFNGGDSTNATLSFQPGSSCTTPCTTTLSVTQPSGFATPSPGGQLTVTVNMPAITLSVPGGTIGANLETSGGGSLDAPAPNYTPPGGQPSGGLPITITSNNPNVLLSNCQQVLGCTGTATDVGSQSITVVVPAGLGMNGNSFPGYYVQALASSGTAVLTASAPGFISGTFTVTLAPSGFVISGSNGVGGQVAASVGSNVNLNITSVVLDGSLAPTQIVQPVRGGISPAVTVTSDSAAGVVATVAASGVFPSPVVIAGGNSSGQVTVQAVSQGTANITAAAPSGFTTPSFGSQLQMVIQ